MLSAKIQSRKEYVYRTMESPVGRLKLVASNEGLAAILWENDNPRRVRLGSPAEDASHPVLLEVEGQLNEYFAGSRKVFSLKLDFAGTTFQRQVWQALLTIPYGETRSYAQIAKQIRQPAAVRAVGAANGKNPISIIAPCHRVIGSNGHLTGFAGGLETKAYLLALESPRDRSPAQLDLYSTGVLLAIGQHIGMFAHAAPRQEPPVVRSRPILRAPC
jgi:methylated-DNA-[protein]-cysteine S-methyltransferase